MFFSPILVEQIVKMSNPYFTPKVWGGVFFCECAFA